MANPKLSIMGKKLILSEHSMRPRESGPGDRLRGTMWTISGQESTPRQSIEEVRVIQRQILGLNDLVSAVPIVSDQSPQMNGWHRIVRATTNPKEHGGVTLCLDWGLQTLTVDAELELRLSGMTIPNSLGTGGTQLSGTPRIGIPAAALGVFFPSSSDALPTTDVTAENDEIVRRWALTGAQARSGARFDLDAANGSDGQCTISFDGRAVVGLRPANLTPATWEISNGLVRLRSGAMNGEMIFEKYTNAWETVTTLTPFGSLTDANAVAAGSNLSDRMQLINLPQNEQHACTISLVYAFPEKGIRRDLQINIRRGSTIIGLATRGEYFYIRPSGTITKTDPYLYNGGEWVAGTNQASVGGTKGNYISLTRDGDANITGFIGIPSVSGIAARRVLAREWLGARGAFLNWVLK